MRATIDRQSLAYRCDCRVDRIPHAILRRNRLHQPVGAFNLGRASK
jgi:hypothetical protein